MKEMFAWFTKSFIQRKKYQDEIAELSEQIGNLEGTCEDLRNLTENLRESIRQKDKCIFELREDLQGTLRQLQRANRFLGEECMSKTLLDRTNVHLNDLASAMDSGDEEKMKMAVEYLEWSNPLSRIAARHLSILRILNETGRMSTDESVK